MPASNIVITDYIPTGLTLNDTNRSTVSNNETTTTISSLAAGASSSVDITFTINASANAGDTITNRAEIESDNGDDIDSTP